MAKVWTVAAALTIIIGKGPPLYPAVVCLGKQLLPRFKEKKCMSEWDHDLLFKRGKK